MADNSDGSPSLFWAGASSDGETATLALAGEFDFAVVDIVRDKFAEACAGEPSRVEIDLRELTFVDSTAIAFLLGATKEEDGPALGFVPSEDLAVQRVFAITGVTELFGGAGDSDVLPRRA